MTWRTAELDRFVEESDRLGGPGSKGCQAFWTAFSVEPEHGVDQSLDPFGEAYVAQQMRLYEELSGKPYDSHANEQTEFDIARHIAATNPYDHPDPAVLALHIQRLSRAFRLGRAARDELLLDMGCGWGLSSEVAAYLGLRVSAVDINPSFVRLVNERAARSGTRISAVQSTFESFSPSEPVDLVLFYECLHHAVRPWTVLERVAANLKPGGRLLLAGEPVNDIWWQHWGLRLDAMSVYCIRKFGWFESGWSLPFVTAMLERAGLDPEVFRDADPDVDLTIVAGRQAAVLSGRKAAERSPGFGCVPDGEVAVLTGQGTLTIRFPRGATAAVLQFMNHRPKLLSVGIEVDGHVLMTGGLAPGPARLTLTRAQATAELRFTVEGWSPDAEIGNGDRRTIGLHLVQVTFDGL